MLFQLPSSVASSPKPKSCKPGMRKKNPNLKAQASQTLNCPAAATQIRRRRRTITVIILIHTHGTNNTNNTKLDLVKITLRLRGIRVNKNTTYCNKTNQTIIMVIIVNDLETRLLLPGSRDFVLLGFRSLSKCGLESRVQGLG